MRWSTRRLWRHRDTSTTAATPERPTAIRPLALTELPIGAQAPISPPPDPAGAAEQPSPIAYPADTPFGVAVVVVGAAGALTRLADNLPESWTVDVVDEVGDVTVADLVVLVQPTAGKVASLLARQPEASVIALAHPVARVDTVVELLQAGATACVRSADAQLVAAHLVACARRYPAHVA
jgi:hypothetical protein